MTWHVVAGLQGRDCGAMRMTVLASMETDDRTQCVDFFVREDGTFGFEQFRAEFDGSGRWQSLSRYGQRAFGSGEETLQAAKQQISWLSRDEVWRW